MVSAKKNAGKKSTSFEELKAKLLESVDSNVYDSSDDSDDEELELKPDSDDSGDDENIVDDDDAEESDDKEEEPKKLANEDGDDSEKEESEVYEESDSDDEVVEEPIQKNLLDDEDDEEEVPAKKVKRDVVESVKESKQEAERKMNYTVEEDEKNRTIFVKNLTHLIQKEDIENHFDKFGDISKIYIHLKLKKTNVYHRVFAIVTFAEDSSVEKALQLHGTIFKDQKIEVIKYERMEQLPKVCTLSITNISKNTSPNNIFNHFKDCGVVSSYNFNSFSYTATIKFTNVSDVQKALALNGSKLDDQNIKVEVESLSVNVPQKSAAKKPQQKKQGPSPQNKKKFIQQRLEKKMRKNAQATPAAPVPHFYSVSGNKNNDQQNNPFYKKSKTSFKYQGTKKPMNFKPKKFRPRQPQPAN